MLAHHLEAAAVDPVLHLAVERHCPWVREREIHTHIDIQRCLGEEVVPFGAMHRSQAPEGLTTVPSLPQGCHHGQNTLLHFHGFLLGLNQGSRMSVSVVAAAPISYAVTPAAVEACAFDVHASAEVHTADIVYLAVACSGHWV